MSAVDERLVELELRYLSLQDEFDKLSGVVYEQQKQLNVYELELRRLREAFASQPWAEGGLSNDKPPHY